MRSKKTKKPARSIRYLLSANPKFQRISVRRLSPPRPSSPADQTKKAPKKVRSIDTASAKRAFVLAAVFITTVGVLIAASRPSRQPGVAAAPAQPQAASRADATVPPRANTTPDKVNATVQQDAPKMGAAKAPAASLPAKSVAVVEPPVKTATPESTAKALAVEPPANANVESSAPVTITGCLETDEETFWLKDTSGADTPKSRSWKWGFMKKRSSNIELVDSAHTLELKNYVGQRVTATGMLTGREMRTHSLQSVASSCN